MTTRTLCMAVLLILAPGAGVAWAESGFYLAGKLGTTSVDARLDAAFSPVLSGDDEGFGFGAGLRLGDHLAVELVYQDLGTVTGTSSACADPRDLCIALAVPVAADTTAVSLTALPHLPISDSFFVYGKLGVVSWETKLTETLSALEDVLGDHSEEDILYGLGVRYLLPGPVGIFVEVERLADEFDSVSVGATLGF